MNAVRACPVGINPYAALKSVADALDLPRSLLGAALGAVDWMEIAGNWLSE